MQNSEKTIFSARIKAIDSQFYLYHFGWKNTLFGPIAAGNGFGPVVRGFVRLPGRFYLALPKETALCGVSG